MGKAIMVMGTASGVGKSTVVLALCRLLKERGYNVASFKAQNITDRLHRLPDGKVMATSSRIAALACGVEPHIDMAPVLLRPSEGGGVDVFLHGDQIEATTFDEIRSRLFDEAFSAYERLLKHHDIVVIEGAGSPVELNLMEQDIVNMNFARRAGVPALLVGDIHRGGVYASIYGTLALLTPEERALFKGVIVNKFRGDPALFNDGRGIMEEVTELPVWGVLPYTTVSIEDEDRLTEGRLKTSESLAGINEEEAIHQLAIEIEKHLDVTHLMKIIDKGV